MLIFYVPVPKTGRYISYRITGRESCNVVDSVKGNLLYAPIINFESKISPLKTKSRTYEDQIHPIKISDLGSLARLTYDPTVPDDPNLTLLTFKHKRSWLLGFITTFDTIDSAYQFNYVDLEAEPTKPFLQYRANKGKAPEFTDTLRHGFSYFSIIKIKEDHPIFGMCRT